MKWINIQDDLPKDGDQVLALVNSYFPFDNPLVQKRSNKIFQGSFNRCRGWNIKFCPEDYYVTYWMPLPEKPEE